MDCSVCARMYYGRTRVLCAALHSAGEGFTRSECTLARFFQAHEPRGSPTGLSDPALSEARLPSALKAYSLELNHGSPST